MAGLSKMPHNRFFKDTDFDSLLKKARATKLLRPTVTLVIKQEKTDHYLLQQKRTDRPGSRFDLLKGGIDQDETIIEALYREAWEECRIDTGTIVTIKPIGFIISPFSTKNKRRDGYRLGKLHFVHFVMIGEHYIPQVGEDHNVLAAFLAKTPLDYFTKKHGNPYIGKIIKAAKKLADE